MPLTAPLIRDSTNAQHCTKVKQLLEGAKPQAKSAWVMASAALQRVHSNSDSMEHLHLCTDCDEGILGHVWVNSETVYSENMLACLSCVVCLVYEMCLPWQWGLLGLINRNTVLDSRQFIYFLRRSRAVGLFAIWNYLRGSSCFLLGHNWLFLTGSIVCKRQILYFSRCVCCASCSRTLQWWDFRNTKSWSFPGSFKNKTTFTGFQHQPHLAHTFSTSQSEVL